MPSADFPIPRVLGKIYTYINATHIDIIIIVVDIMIIIIKLTILIKIISENQ